MRTPADTTTEKPDTEDPYELAVTLVNQISRELKDVVNRTLKGTDPDVEEEVRLLLNEQMRFWKEY